MYKKLLISFEGIETSGKSTHIKNVASYLKSRNYKFIKFREPGGSKNSEKIRKLILNKKNNFNNKTDLLLYLASRSENFNSLINQNYRKKIILIDRFIDSTFAYQYGGMGLNKKIIDILNKFILGSLKPDFTFFFIVNKNSLRERLKRRKNLNRYDKFNFGFYSKVQSSFLKLSKKKRHMIINSNNDLKINKKIVLNKLDKILK